MPLSSKQMIALACQTARAPGYTVQAGEFLNQILSDLCQDHDFDLAKAIYPFNLSPGATKVVSGQIVFGGPMALPADFLRSAGPRALTYWISGVSYQPVKIDLDQFDMLVQQAGNINYPNLWTDNLSLADEATDGLTAPELYVYPAPSGSFGAQLRYYRQMPDIATPETSDTVPWFPNQGYLQKKLTAYVMALANDPRAEKFDVRAEEDKRAYLRLKDDPEGNTKRVRLDRRSYGAGNFAGLRNTKTTGW